MMFDFYVCCFLLYCILLLYKNYRQYLVRYLIFIYIRYGVYHLKRHIPQVRFAPQGFKRLLRLKCTLRLNSQEAFASRYALNNYEFKIHYVPIYRKASQRF